MKVSFFEKTITRLGLSFNVLASAALFAMMLLTSLDVGMRYLFNRPIAGVYDLVGLMGAVVVSFSMPYTMLERGHVAVDLVIRRLSRNKQLVVETVIHIVSVLLFLTLVWQSFVLAMDMKAAGEVTPILLIPFYPIVYCMGICFFVLCLAVIVNFISIWQKGVKK